MNIRQYLQEFAVLRAGGNFRTTPLGRRLADVYTDNHQILAGQVERYVEVLQKYHRLYGAQDVVIARAPGRVDLLGSHTDYHQGYVLPMAIDKDTVIVAGKRPDRKIRLANTDAHFAGEAFALEPEIPRSPAGHWENYVKASVQAFIRAYGLERLSGLNLVVAGSSPYSVPMAVGLSSSSALVIATAIALAQLHEIAIKPKPFARFCGEAEWYVGTRGGFMDHCTSILSQKGYPLFLDCRPVHVDDTETFVTADIPLPPGYAVVICNTNVQKEKSASAEYNTRVLECQLGLELLKPHFPTARYLRDIPADAPLHTLLPESLTLAELHGQLERTNLSRIIREHQVAPAQSLQIRSRCQHVIMENQRVLQGCECLQAGQVDAFGDLMTASYQSMRDKFAASCAQLDLMIALARQAPGAVGARIAGAGWGGCAVALVQVSALAAFQQQVTTAYVRQTGLQAQLFICQPSQGAGVV